jgi:SAM-dependent methyltransferase
MQQQSLYLATRATEYAVGLAPGDGTPVPPLELMEYGESPERHLETGRRNVESMIAALEQSGFEWSSCSRVLEFGCCNGKLVRWLAPFAEGREIWGVDVQAEKVMWAMQNLSPPLRFATTTTIPHLPFADGSFDLIFAGSVFTHIGELHVAWLAELTRLLGPRGFLDETSIKVAAEDPTRHDRFSKLIADSSFAEALMSGDFGFVSTAPYGSAMLSQVMMSSAYVRHIAQPLMLAGTFARAYADFQTGYVFRRQ